MRLAAIDIGTNSVHMIVVHVRPDLSFEIVDREKEMVRLGSGGLDGKALTPTAMTSALQALSKFRRLADSHHVDEIIAAATSATREAENGGDFLDAVHRETGILVRVISGKDEARLIHLAAAYGVDLAGKRGVVIDIGGGSVEITLGPARDVELAQSFKVGVIRLTERFVRSDPLTGRDERRLVRFIDDQVGGARRPDRVARLPARHRDLGHHPESGRGRARRRCPFRRGRPEPARVGQAAAPDPQASRGERSAGAPGRYRASIRAAPISRWPGASCSTRSSAGWEPRN